MNAFLQIRSGTSDVVALDGDRAAIGRSDTNTLVVRDPVASRLHALMERVEDRWVIRDLGSRNGTYVNGERIIGDRVLHAGDELRIGGTRILFHQSHSHLDHLEPTHAADGAPSLTRREKEVLVALCSPSPDTTFWSPASVRVMAETLHLSEAGVKQHLSRLYDKFGLTEGADRRTRLANEALRRGAVSLADVQQR